MTDGGCRCTVRDLKPNGHCRRCGLRPQAPVHVPHIERCGKCRHPFDWHAGGGAGVSLVPADGWMGDEFRQVHLCSDCRDALRSWIGLAPVGVDPGLIP